MLVLLGYKVVMVAIYNEDGELDVEVCIVEVGLIVEFVLFDWNSAKIAAEYILLEDVNALEEAVLWGPFFMKEIAMMNYLLYPAMIRKSTLFFSAIWRISSKAS